ncbi:unnamed protein product [Mycena citricolor]|uniref:Alpha-type protein kinase domain-containing protein n=1 Tax=Mycena citricolor TaxID=2018698 RepID=A0AAD2HYG4_9AGAR|nr:unnamed protein product [Mycena citricolor]
MSSETVYATFTDDISTQEPFECRSGARCYTRPRPDLNKGHIIMPDHPRYRVGNQSSTSASRIVCKACHEHYRTKASSTIGAPTKVSLERERDSIRLQNIEGRIGDASQAGVIAAVPQVLESMGPPQFVPHQQGSASGPRLSLPKSSSSNMGRHQAGTEQYSSKGYSAAHQQYLPSRQRWAQMAYSGTPQEIATVKIGVRYEAPGKENGVSFGTISEGKNIHAKATAAEIIQLVIEVATAKLHAEIADQTKSMFTFDESRFVVREAETWINIHEELPDQPILYNRCLKKGRSRADQGKLVYSRPSKPFLYVLVINSKEWQQFLNFQEDHFDAVSQIESVSERSSHRPDPTVDAFLEAPVFRLTRSKTSTLSQKKSVPADTTGIQVMASSLQSLSARSSVQNGLILETSQKPATISSVGSGSKKRSAEDDNEPQRQRPCHDLDIHEIKTVEDVYHPVDLKRMAKALTLSGSVPASSREAAAHITETIEFFRVRSAPLSVVLESAKAFTCDIADKEVGSLSLKTFLPPLGVGTFKSAHSAYLTLASLSSTPLGAAPNQLVALKRMFTKRHTLKRFSPVEEFQHTTSEANLLFWGTTLLNFTYSFIRDYISKHSSPPAELPIYAIRFVEAGVALVHDSAATGSSSKNTSSLLRSYLIEEMIETRKFVKFINNNSALPVASLDPELYPIAVFLCFTQHVQYEHTGKLVIAWTPD